jgi:hypothetical protein
MDIYPLFTELVVKYWRLFLFDKDMCHFELFKFDQSILMIGDCGIVF